MFHSDVDGTPRLNLVVSSVTASVKQTTWNLSVAASMNSVTIKDYFACGGEGGVAGEAEPQLLLAAVAENEQDEGGKFLSVEYVKVTVGHYHYKTLS